MLATDGQFDVVSVVGILGMFRIGVLEKVEADSEKERKIVRCSILESELIDEGAIEVHKDPESKMYGVSCFLGQQ